MTEPDPAAFIVGTGRCGSTLLSNLLSRDPDVLSLSEFFHMLEPGAFPPGEIDARTFTAMLTTPRPWVTLAGRHGLEYAAERHYDVTGSSRFSRRSGVPPISVMTLPHLSDDPDALLDEVLAFAWGLCPAPIEVQYRRLFEWLTRRFGRRLWLERSGGSLAYVEQLVRGFPDARFVHIVREGPSCALSMSRFTTTRLWAVGLEFQRRFGFDPYRQGLTSADVGSLPRPWAQLLPDTFDRSEYESLVIPLRRFGALWSWQILNGMDVLDRLPEDRLMTIWYERLVAEPRHELGRLARFLDLSDAPRWAEEGAAEVRSGPRPRPELSAADARSLGAACRMGMERLANSPSASRARERVVVTGAPVGPAGAPAP